MFLLPTSLIACTHKYFKESSDIYRSCALLALGLATASLTFVIKCHKKKELKDIVIWDFALSAGGVVAFLLYGKGKYLIHVSVHLHNKMLPFKEFCTAYPAGC